MWKKLAAKIPDISPFPPGWLFVRGRNPIMENLRRKGHSNFMSRFPALMRYGVTFLLLAYWPLRGAYLAYNAAKHLGAHAEEVSGKGKTAQFFEQWFLSIWYSIHPWEYYAFSLYSEKSWQRFDLFFYRYGKGLIPGSRSEQLKYAVVQDKNLFEKFCTLHGFPCAQTLLIVEKGDKTKFGEILRLVRGQSLFLKTTAGSRGEGCFSLRYLGEERYLVNKARVLSCEALEELLAKRFRDSAYLVQPLVVNHPKLGDITNGSLSTLRIVTLLTHPQGEAEYLTGIFQSPIGKSVTSNCGLACPIDRETGKLGAGFFPMPLHAPKPNHPVAGENLAGRTLPFWLETVELVLAAHTALGGVASLGWDVAITEAGPLLLETNSGWDPMTIQRAANKPLGETRLPWVLKGYRESQRQVL